MRLRCVFAASDPEAAILLRGREEAARRSLSGAYLNFYSKTFQCPSQETGWVKGSLVCKPERPQGLTKKEREQGKRRESYRNRRQRDRNVHGGCIISLTAEQQNAGFSRARKRLRKKQKQNSGELTKRCSSRRVFKQFSQYIR